jgi:cytochrome c biogenesis protein ResB
VEIEGVWGSKEIKLPFYLYLKDFVLKRYPGSDKASSYESHVVLIDEKEGVEVPYVIYMNNPLKYKGYRIFQTSYDKDEKGSVLSVNYDPGAMPTYTGYAVLFLGLVLNLLKRRM